MEAEITLLMYIDNALQECAYIPFGPDEVPKVGDYVIQFIVTGDNTNPATATSVIKIPYVVESDDAIHGPTGCVVKDVICGMRREVAVGTSMVIDRVAYCWGKASAKLSDICKSLHKTLTGGKDYLKYAVEACKEMSQNLDNVILSVNDESRPYVPIGIYLISYYTNGAGEKDYPYDVYRVMTQEVIPYKITSVTTGKSYEVDVCKPDVKVDGYNVHFRVASHLTASYAQRLWLETCGADVKRSQSRFDALLNAAKIAGNV